MKLFELDLGWMFFDVIGEKSDLPDSLPRPKERKGCKQNIKRNIKMFPMLKSDA